MDVCHVSVSVTQLSCGLVEEGQGWGQVQRDG